MGNAHLEFIFYVYIHFGPQVPDVALFDTNFADNKEENLKRENKKKQDTQLKTRDNRRIIIFWESNDSTVETNEIGGLYNFKFLHPEAIFNFIKKKYNSAFIVWKKKSISIVTGSSVFKIFDSERINKKILWKNKDEIELFLIGLFFHYYFVEWLGFFIKGLNCFFFFKEKEKEFELGKAMNSG